MRLKKYSDEKTTKNIREVNISVPIKKLGQVVNGIFFSIYESFPYKRRKNHDLKINFC